MWCNLQHLPHCDIANKAQVTATMLCDMQLTTQIHNSKEAAAIPDMVHKRTYTG